jgi:hypothetical protein
MEQLSIAVGCRAAVAEKGFFNLIAIDGERLMIGAVRSESAAVFINVFVAGRLIHVPDAAIARVFGIERQDGSRCLGISAEGNVATEDTGNQ